MHTNLRTPTPTDFPQTTPSKSNVDPETSESASSNIRFSNPEMSTRRSTRATSRQASEVGTTPAISASDMPATPSARSPRKKTATPLPTLGSKVSNAYGRTSVPKLGAGVGPEASVEIGSVLEDLLQSVPEDEVPADDDTIASRVRRGHTNVRGGRGRGATGTPVPQSVVNRSYREESALFGPGGALSSALPSPGDLYERTYPNRPEPRQPGLVAQQPKEDIQLGYIKKLAEQRVEREHEILAAEPAPMERLVEGIKDIPHKVFEFAKSIRDFIGPEIFGIVCFLVLALLASTLASPGGWNVKNGISQFIPDFVAHPVEYFSSDEVSNLQSRVRIVEREISLLKKNSELDRETLAKLDQILPDVIVLKKDFLGKLRLPDDLWTAIQDKIRKDHSLGVGKAEKCDSSSTSNLSLKDVENIAEGVAGKAWENFLRTNQHKIKSSGSSNSHHFKDDLLAHKSDVLDMIRSNWDEHKSSIHSEMEHLNHRFEEFSNDISKLQYGSGSLSKAELKALAKDTFKKMLPTAQLEALAKSNQKININFGLARVNHFSKGTGAVVDHHLTSPNYAFESMQVSPYERFSRYMLNNPVPIPNPPEAALTKWEESGDCWCSASSDSGGFGPSIGVIMGSSIYPEQVVIEHIAASASLEPGSAPREMELLAYVPDQDTYNNVKRTSDEIFKGETEVELEHAYRYTRIATFTYDMESGESVQAFPVQLDLKEFGGHTNKLIVRAKSNWGGVDYTCLYRIRVHGEIVVTPGLY